MEDSPLTLAHQHALHASNIISSASPPYSSSVLSDAASYHTLAATAFASAAKTTKDPEAQRTLDLLVSEHERWAARLKRQAEKPAGAGLETVVEGSSVPRKEGDGPTDASRDRETHRETPPHLPHPLAAGSTSHYPARLQKSTSSLATNLASARGIPQSQPPARISSTGSTSSRRRRSGPLTLPPNPENHSSSSKPTTSPLNLIPPDQPSATKHASSQEEPFSKFYASLNTLINRIGSPFAASLAFAGLPVGEGPNDNEVSADILPRGWTQGRGRGRNLTLDNDHAGGESFYVVPTTGGTTSYAGIVRQDNSGTSENDSERSVRRNKTYPGKTPGTSIVTSPSYPTSLAEDEFAQFSGHSKTQEELQLENSTLRRTVEHMARNMQVWQKRSKESESMLKNSIMAMSKNTGGSTGMDILSQVQRRSWIHAPDEAEDSTFGGRRAGEVTQNDEDERLRALEEELREKRAAIDKMTHENEKLKKIVQDFKDKWSKLAERAKKRDRNKPSASSTEEASTKSRLNKVDENE